MKEPGKYTISLSPTGHAMKAAGQAAKASGQAGNTSGQAQMRVSKPQNTGLYLLGFIFWESIFTLVVSLVFFLIMAVASWMGAPDDVVELSPAIVLFILVVPAIYSEYFGKKRK